MKKLLTALLVLLLINIFPLNNLGAKPYSWRHRNRQVYHQKMKHQEGRQVKTDRDKCWDKNEDGRLSTAEIESMNKTKKRCPER